MKKLISLMATALISLGTVSVTSYADDSDLMHRETITLNTFEEVRDFFISEDAELSDGKLFYPDDYKIEIREGKESCTIIIYGLKDVQDISDIVHKALKNGHSLSSYPEYHSGISMGYHNSDYMLRYNDISKFNILFFVDNTLTDWLNNDISPLEAAKNYSFDVIPYVYPNLISGDADCDGAITAADASQVLSAYSLLSTGKNPILNSTIFDYDNSGAVDADDASQILAEYARLSTTKK